MEETATGQQPTGDGESIPTEPRSAIVPIPAIVSIIVAILCGSLLALTVPWLPMLLASILLFLAGLIVHIVLGTGFAAALGWSCLSLAILQFAYVLVGRMPYRIRRYPQMIKSTSLFSGDGRRK